MALNKIIHFIYSRTKLQLLIYTAIGIFFWTKITRLCAITVRPHCSSCLLLSARILYGRLLNGRRECFLRPIGCLFLCVAPYALRFY